MYVCKVLIDQVAAAGHFDSRFIPLLFIVDHGAPLHFLAHLKEDFDQLIRDEALVLYGGE
jgi:hypothetical protein